MGIPDYLHLSSPTPPFYSLPSLHNGLLKVGRVFCPTLYIAKMIHRLSNDKLCYICQMVTPGNNVSMLHVLNGDTWHAISGDNTWHGIHVR